MRKPPKIDLGMTSYDELFMNDEERLSVANKEDFKYAIYDYSATFKGWSYMSPGLNIEPRKTNK